MQEFKDWEGIEQMKRAVEMRCKVGSCIRVQRSRMAFKEERTIPSKIDLLGHQNDRQLTDSGLVIYAGIELSGAIKSNGSKARLNDYAERILVRGVKIEMTR